MVKSETCTAEEGLQLMLQQSGFDKITNNAHCHLMESSGELALALHIHRLEASKERKCLEHVLEIIHKWNGNPNLPRITKVLLNVFCSYSAVETLCKNEMN